jgi:hypothetical protein
MVLCLGLKLCQSFQNFIVYNLGRGNELNREGTLLATQICLVAWEWIKNNDEKFVVIGWQTMYF